MRKQTSIRTALIAPLMLMLAALVPGPSRAQVPITTSFAYVTNQGDGTVSIINTTTNQTMGDPIPTCSECDNNPGPSGIAVTPNGRFLYVANQFAGSVGVIDLNTRSVTDIFSLCNCESSQTPIGVAITPDGKFAYVTDSGNGLVYQIQTSNNSVLSRIPVGADPSGIAVDPTGSLVYVTNTGGGTVSVISTATNTVTSTISVGGDPTSVAFQPGAHVAYVTNNGDGTISIINTTTNGVTNAISLTPCDDTASPYFVAFTPDGASAYVTDQEGCGNNLQVINTATQTLTDARILVDSTPVEVAITPDGTTAYVVVGNNDGRGSLVPISTATNVAGDGITVGYTPFGVAIGPVSETQTLGSGPQTLTFPFLNGGASISFTFPEGWCAHIPCTVTAAAKDEPDSVWQAIDSANYPDTDIAPITGLPGNGQAHGDGLVYTVTCTDSTGAVCNQGNTGDGTIYTTSMNWQTAVDDSCTGPGLGKEEAATWENILGACTSTGDPAAGTSGSSRDGLSRWASFYHIPGTTSASINITTPTAGASYLLNQKVLANYSCTDAVECAGTVASGSPIDTSSVGMKTFTAEADVTSGPTASQTVSYDVVACHDVSFAFNPSTVAAGRFTIVTATVSSCGNGKQKNTVVDFILTGPFGRACGISRTLMFATPPFTLGGGTLKFPFPLLIPPGACAGTYTVTANTYVAGTLVDSSSSSLVVTAH